jgi:hypothetical protein
MDKSQQDIWMILRENWVPRPDWLSNDTASLASSGVQPIERQAEAPGGRAEVPISSLEPGTARASKHENLPYGAEGSKKKPIARQAGVSAANRKLRSSAGRGRSGRGSTTGNVIELWPRARDYAYADCILIALCSACAAQAAGQDEIMMARIRQLYHLFEDVAG